MPQRWIVPGFAALYLLAATGAGAVPVFLGPVGGSGLSGEYAQASDSPFSGGSFSFFYLEDFEDHLFNTPGVSANNGGVTSVVFGPSIHDSVDLDDGVLDGSGLAGDSYFFTSGSSGVTFTFDSVALGALPTHVGVVWTDGSGSTTLQAFDGNGFSLGSISALVADGVNNGTTRDDYFFGVVDPAGIGAIRISNQSGGIEVDHLQYGLSRRAPEPASTLLLLAGALALLGAGRSSKPQ